MTALAASSAVDRIRALAPHARPRIAVVLGSGWSGLTAHLVEPVRIPYAALDGFPRATVFGHVGELWLGRLGPHQVAVLSGRKHAYEDGDVRGMAVPLRALAALGCSVLVQTNAAGSLRAEMPPGSLMAIADHLNLPQRSPLVGETGAERFVNMQNAYDPALRAVASDVAQARGTTLHEGVYAWCFGPQFETPAEVRMCRLLGADAVGMSTVPETLLARHAGLRVLAISLMTNMGAGLSDESLSHAHTLQQAGRSSEDISRLLSEVIAALPV